MGQKSPKNGQPGKWRDPEWVSRVVALALDNPEWGCDRLAYYLYLKGHAISAPTVQRILNAQGLQTVEKRKGREERDPT